MVRATPELKEILPDFQGQSVSEAWGGVAAAEQWSPAGVGSGPQLSSQGVTKNPPLLAWTSFVL